jgi:hypothetical protein
VSAPSPRQETAFDLVSAPNALLLGLVAAVLVAICIVFAPRAVA